MRGSPRRGPIEIPERLLNAAAQAARSTSGREVSCRVACLRLLPVSCQWMAVLEIAGCVVPCHKAFASYSDGRREGTIRARYAYAL